MLTEYVYKQRMSANEESENYNILSIPTARQTESKDATNDEYNSQFLLKLKNNHPIYTHLST
jgi:hypothetical protein